MRKISALLLCLALVLPLTVYANDYTPSEDYYDDYDDDYDHHYNYDYHDYGTEYDYYEADYYEADNYMQEPDTTPVRDHFATATIEDLHTSAGYMPIYATGDSLLQEEAVSFEPPPSPPVIPPPRYTSAATIIMDADTGLVLYGSDHNTAHFPASVTKVMTALLVLEHVHDLSERIEFSHNAVFSIPRNSSHIAMDVGETLTVMQALYGLMLSSANEVSIALAEHVAGTVYEFVDLMNRRAESLGATNTNFENPSGLHGTMHITTAYDMALIMREAVNHPVFVEVISTLRYSIPPTERQPYSRPLLNTNRLIQAGSYFNEWVVGGKTGWTHAARHTLVTYAVRDGRRLIIVTLNSEGGGTFRDTLALMSFGFSMPFEERLVFESGIYTRRVPVYQDIDGRPLNIGYVAVQADDDLHFKLPADFDIRELRYELSLPERIAPPVLAGDIVGQVVVYIQNLRAGELNLIAQNLVLSLPASTHDDRHAAGGSERTGPMQYASPPMGYPSLTAYPTPIWANEFLLTVVTPVAVSVLTILISVFFIITSRKRRMRKVLKGNRRIRYYGSYRYK
ncbi:MAG: D-alanyl-D-alanine carboxypeptidase [Defluviitaleaceae bacterium]|nr:D-alanyl-D-alanine carboxypeptidase [Defluviitaleaceae bacterium]